MAFIGNSLGNITTEIRTIDTMVGDGSTTTITLSKTPGSVNNVEVFFDGIFQTPGEDFTLSDNTLTFTTAPTTGINVVAISGNDSQVVFPDANSITTKKILDNTITSDKFVDIAVEKLSGTLSALDGSAVTGLILPDVVDVTTAASDPTRTTNKPVGSLAVNSTSGEMFICTDAETDNNTWMNVGVGTGHITYTPPVTESFGGIGGGTSSGYNSGGGEVTHIQKFSLVSNGSASHVGNLSVARYKICGNSSTTHGYTSGGQSGPVTFMDTIDKFSFSTHGTASDVGNLPSHGQINAQPQSDGTTSSGYASGGYSAGGVVGVKSKFSFTTDGDSVSIGNLTVFRNHGAGQSAPYKGYACGGNPVGSGNVIEEFLFASAVDTFDVGDLAIGRYYTAGQSSNTYGYVSGGNDESTHNNISSIEKFSFSTTVVVSSQGDLSGTRTSIAGQSSVTDGYITGGYTTGAVNTIDKFSFSTGGTAADIGDLQTGLSNCCGQQI